MFITLDDMNRDSVGVYGSKVKGTTPNIDKLAKQGLRFEHGHVSIAICMPTRAVWMTGRYPHNSGALGFTKIKPDVPTLPETLQGNGYMTGILGKTEHVVPSRQEAFGYRRDRSEMDNGRSQELYGKFTAEFLGQVKKADKPFFLMVNSHDPHRPFDNRKPAEQRSVAEKTGDKKKKGRGADYPAPPESINPRRLLSPAFFPICPPSGRRSPSTIVP